MNERELFLAAVELHDSHERQAFLDSHCGDDPALRSRVKALIASHEGQSEFLRVPAMQQIVGDSDEPGAVTEDEFACVDAESAIEMIRPYLLEPSREDSLGRLGHYEVLELIGCGAFGVVLKAFDDKLQRVVAMKVLSTRLAATSPARKRFLREARCSAQVRHENVVGIYAVEEEPIPYLVMEYVPGQTLQDRLNGQGPLELLDVLRMGQQIANGLAAAHAQGLIHRDVKPGNILLDVGSDERVKITDFGLARAVDDASMTQSGVIAGTPLYMAPEQALGGRLDVRADLFSLGSVLYQMLSGRPPFRARSSIAVLKRVVEDEPRPIQEIIPEIPDWMCEIIQILHAKDPEDRFESASQVASLLGQCHADLNEGRTPMIDHPTLQSGDRSIAKPSAPPKVGILHSPLVKIAAAAMLVFGVLAFAEASEVTEISKSIIRIMMPGQGTLVVEVDDPSATVVLDGEELALSADGLKELRLKPGKHGVLVTRPGTKPQQELVQVVRDGRTVFVVRRESQEISIRSDRDEMVSPFDGVRWDEKYPEVKVGETWYELSAINDLPAKEIVDFCIVRYEDKWQKRFEEDLVRVMREMGKVPGESVDLTVTAIGGGDEKVLRDVAMTREKRQELWRSMESRRRDAK